MTKLFKQIEYRMLEARAKRDNTLMEEFHHDYWNGKAKAYKTILNLIKKQSR